MLFNLVRVTTDTVGVGTISLGAAIAGCLTFSGASIPNGSVVSYGISDGINSEVGRGAYNSSANTLTRDLVLASTNGGSKISLSGSAQVFITVLAEDIQLTRYVAIEVFAPPTLNATGTYKKVFPVPPEFDGMNLVYVHAHHRVAGVTGTDSIQIKNVTKSKNMLSTVLSVDSGEQSSNTAATPAVIDTTADDVSVYDELSVDISAIHTTPAYGLVITLGFRKP